MPPEPDENSILDQFIEQDIEELVTARKHLHQRPELSGHEHATQAFILSFLESRCKAQLNKIAHTGVLASFNSGKDKGILIRVDIDALPIQEINEFSYRSEQSGVSHKCGHDGHTTIGLGLALLLEHRQIKDITIHLLFQPAEENGMGAQAVLDDPLFETLKINKVFALHNLPGFKTHQVATKENSFTPAVRSLIIQMQGRTSHAAEPEKGINPASALAKLIELAERYTYNEADEDEFFLATVIYSHLGEKAYGISAGSAELHLTFRAWDTPYMKTRSEAFVREALELCNAYQLNTEISWLEEFEANQNATEAVDLIKVAAAKNKLTIKQLVRPFRWGEDFGSFTQRYPGAMFGLGAGKEVPALHNPDYDFPDEIIPTGVKMFYRIIEEEALT